MQSKGTARNNNAYADLEDHLKSIEHLRRKALERQRKQRERQYQNTARGPL